MAYVANFKTLGDLDAELYQTAYDPESHKALAGRVIGEVQSISSDCTVPWLIALMERAEEALKLEVRDIYDDSPESSALEVNWCLESPFFGSPDLGFVSWLVRQGTKNQDKWTFSATCKGRYKTAALLVIRSVPME